MGQVTILVGTQWGDEGKGKWVHHLSSKSDITARFQGGNNAGHTIYQNNEKLVLHQLPCGLLHNKETEKHKAFLLPGVVINPSSLLEEIKSLQKHCKISPNSLFISEKAHIISPFHGELDSYLESSAKNPIGTTLRGIGPAYASKAARFGLRVGDYVDKEKRTAWIKEIKSSFSFLKIFEKENLHLWDLFHKTAADLQAFVAPSDFMLRKEIKLGKSLLLEGAQGTLLDLDHGTYPYVTSSSTLAAAAPTSVGMDPRKVNKILGVAKAYMTRVGAGSFPSELHDEVGQRIAAKGHEFGATTGRPRRCGWYDAVAMRYAVELNGLDSLILNKIDVLSGFETLKIASSYSHPDFGDLQDFPAKATILDSCSVCYEEFSGWEEDISLIKKKENLPKNLLSYLEAIEDLSKIKVSLLGIGPKKEQFIELEKEKHFFIPPQKEWRQIYKEKEPSRLN